MPPRPWILFSSSSGESFAQMWERLPQAAQKSCRGAFFDRDCPSLAVAQERLGEENCYLLSKESFEEEILERDLPDHTLVLLLGFFKLLSADFLKRFARPIVNTHPSLLPSFPGLDKKVHREAHDKVCVSGITLHLVTAALDGGPILFQHPVAIDPAWSWEESRAELRKAEQCYLPLWWSRLLLTELSVEDSGLSSLAVRRKYPLFIRSFQDLELPSAEVFEYKGMR